MKTTTTRIPHATQVHTFVKSVIRHRRLLITEGKSSINPMAAIKIIDRLERNNLPGFSDRGAARFLVNNEDDIRYLIKQDDVEKFNKFNQLVSISKPLSLL